MSNGSELKPTHAATRKKLLFCLKYVGTSCIDFLPLRVIEIGF
jgi:hypothetical protein